MLPSRSRHLHEGDFASTQARRRRRDQRVRHENVKLVDSTSRIGEILPDPACHTRDRGRFELRWAAADPVDDERRCEQGAGLCECWVLMLLRASREATLGWVSVSKGRCEGFGLTDDDR